MPGAKSIPAMKKPVFLVALLTLTMACGFSFAQQIDVEQPNDTPLDERIVYSHQNTGHVGVNSQGFQIGFNIGRIKNIHTINFWEGELGTLNSLKEIRLSSGYGSRWARPFVYGKINSVFVLRAGFGQERRIYGKPYWGGVELRWFYEGGASLAFMKPYYYNVIVYTPNGNGTYTETLEEHRFDEQNQWMEIVGRASFFKGFNELKLSPGIHAKGGLNFDFSKSESNVRALQCGLELECYPMGVTIIDSQRNRRLFLTFFLAFHWGSRFNKY